MSLFKAREIWSTLVGENEEFDVGCLCVSDLDSTGNDKIIVGSFSGFLRIYSPTISNNKEDQGSVSKPTDFICEINLKFPILQVEAGKFASSTSLAILQNRILTVYALKGQKGITTHGSQYSLEPCYEHKLQKNSFNFCYGAFGGNRNLDLICVQSLDGTLSFFEQEVFLFSRFPPETILPGPIAYFPSTDSIIISKSSRQIEAYKFRNLATAIDSNEAAAKNIAKKISYDWKFIINETAISISIITSGISNFIAVLAERNLYLLSDSGHIIHTKKFEINPSCFLTYFNDRTFHSILATHSKSLLIYENIHRLKWAAQLQSVPVQIKLITIKNFKNLIVTLDEEGNLFCSYLGTKPSIYTRSYAESRDLDYPELNQEIEHLQSIIKDKQSNQSLATRDTSIQNSLNDVKLMLNIENSRSEGFLCSLMIVIQSKVNIKELKLKINMAAPLLCDENAFTYKNIEINNPISKKIQIKLGKAAYIPSNLRIDGVASFISKDEEPRIVSSGILLPSGILFRACDPIKNAVFKLTFDTSQPVVSLSQLYSDLLGEDEDTYSSNIGLQYINTNMIVSVLAAKSSNRYRIQCDELGPMYYVIADLIQRLTELFKGSISISYDSKQLPIQEYMEVIGNHFEARQKKVELSIILEEKAGEYRVVQKRLLSLVKDKTPVSLVNICQLLEQTYQNILESANKIESIEGKLEELGCELSCCNQLICLLLRLSLNLSVEEVKSLENCLSSCITCSSKTSTGWEELTDACITHILRTVLSKGTKDNVSVPTGTLVPPKDVSKVKNHVALLIERITNGARISSSHTPPLESRQKEKLQIPNLDDMRSMDPIIE